jgi:hypothetical protein
MIAKAINTDADWILAFGRGIDGAVKDKSEVALGKI